MLAEYKDTKIGVQPHLPLVSLASIIIIEHSESQTRGHCLLCMSSGAERTGVSSAILVRSLQKSRLSMWLYQEMGSLGGGQFMWVLSLWYLESALQIQPEGRAHFATLCLPSMRRQ